MNKTLTFLFLCMILLLSTSVGAQNPQSKADSIAAHRKYHTWKPNFKDSMDRRLLTSGFIAQAWALLVTGASGKGTPHNIKMVTEGMAAGLVVWTAVAVSTDIAAASMLYIALFSMPTAIIIIAGTGMLFHVIFDPPNGKGPRASTNKHSIDLTLLTDTNSILLCEHYASSYSLCETDKKEVGKKRITNNPH
ncbi:MAG: hypothetical protein V4590_00015 [Bacteroidota bacterium]